MIAPPYPASFESPPPIEQFTAEVVRTWEQAALELSPVIGEAGFRALFARSLYLTRQTYPWLGNTHHEEVEPASPLTSGLGAGLGTFVELQSSLQAQELDQAQAASVALTKTFQGLLVSLIGDSLARRLLASVWIEDSSCEANLDS